MDARLQLRVQRYGWDLAASQYEKSWQPQLAAAQAELLACAAIQPGEHVLDVACGPGGTALQAAMAAGPDGSVLGVDLSERMVQMAAQNAADAGLVNARFLRADAQNLAVPDASFDVAVCSLGLMYVPQPELAVREMQRAVRADGRVLLSVWGERAACGWSSVFPIVDAEISSEVCPLFFRLGGEGVLAGVFREAGLTVICESRLSQTLLYEDAQQACDAAFVGGPVAMAWSRFDQSARLRVCARYLESIQCWRQESGYRIPTEYVIVAARRRA